MMENRAERRIFFLLGFYFLLQLAVRLWASPSLELDEAEQLLLTQQISFGYGPQPPLYTWLQIGFFHLFGVNVFSLALLKNLLLCSTYFFVYRGARLLGYGREVSVAAMLSLFFIPQIAWESQRDLTHSVIAVTITAASIVSWLRLKQDQRIRQYLLVGLCWGAGLLGKYNYAIFLVSLLAASYSTDDYRAVMRRPRIFYSFAVMVAVVFPHVLWAINNMSLLMASSGKFKQAASHSYLSSVARGTGSIFMAALAFSAPLLAIYGVLWYLNHRRSDDGPPEEPAHNPQSNLLLRCIVCTFGICLMMVVLFQVTAFKDRWMQPILFFMPLALLPLMTKALSQGGAKLVRRFAAVVAAVVLIGLATRPLLASYTGHVTRFNFPYKELSEKLAPQIQSADLVLAQSTLLGGNIRLRYPSTRVTAPGSAQLFYDSAPKSLLVLWQDRPTPEQSNTLWNLAGTIMGDYASKVPAASVQAPFRGVPDKTMTLSYVLLKKGLPSR